ncbi:vWA domain-containing protein [Nocardiopsis lambiniae]|uniref:VWA domain-containing protein n=1 Tax=Nocardiopsis lambiniae TaxID=3075539 RepID=A0ABU2MEF3_9ACTN|nr:VWA domain-containing protein [Nocardiopsis sp. DSM 44743]MDT0330656.1 VWA domain-containing protein [Nocardiopsis sp. DSM 44743]
MHLSALLDFDVLPLDTVDAVAVLLDITAPEREEDTERPAATLQIVLDTSGSMHGGRLDGAVNALLGLIDRLAPADNFGVVSFDTQARVEVPCGPLTDKAATRRIIGALRAGGGTDLSSGLLRGVQEARRAGGGSGATLLLISDGHANHGVTDHDLLRQVAADAYGTKVTVATLGYGLGYDEALLGAVSEGGTGSALFAEDPDTAGGLIAQEAEYLLAKSAQAVSLRIPAGERVRAVGVVGEMPSHRLPDGSVVVELGDFHSGEERRLLLRLDVPGVSSLGTVTLTTLEATYVDPSTLTTYTAKLPISVNVVPGDEAAGRVPRPEVRTEEALQRAQTAKKRASEALRRGDRAEAARLLEEAGQNLDDLDPPSPFAGGPAPGGRPAGPPPAAAAQAAELRNMARMAREDDISRAAKTTYASQSGYTRQRGRYEQRARTDPGSPNPQAQTPPRTPPPPVPGGRPGGDGTPGRISGQDPDRRLSAPDDDQDTTTES